jgi:hypothetical protein
MNQQERDELRAKHGKVTTKVDNIEVEPFCLGCASGDAFTEYSEDFPYPCDVIKVLDAWEAAMECDHPAHHSLRPVEPECPKCGVKL